MSLQDWIEESTPDRREVVVCFDRRLLSALVVAKEALEEARLEHSRMLGNDHPELATAVTDLEAKVRAKQRTFVFEGIGWGPWRDLMAKHPPQADQAEVFQRAVQLAFMPHAVENIAYNAETFFPAAMAASCVEPGMTIDQATRLLHSNSQPGGVFDRLFAAVLTVNLTGGDDPLVGPISAVVSDGQRATAKR